MIFFFDNGYGYSKSLSQSGQRVIFPSVAGEVSSYELDFFSNGSGLEIEVSGQSWLLGEEALRQSVMVSDMQNHDWILSPQWRAMLLCAISETTTASHVGVEVVTGLPFGDYTNKPLREQFKRELIDLYQIRRKGRTSQQITIEKVLVIPQNFAPLFTHLSSLDINAYVGVLNIGSHTVDYSTVQLTKGGRPEPIKIQCGSESMGTRTAIKQYKSHMASKQPRYKFTNYEADLKLREPISSASVDILASFTRSLLALVSNNWSDNFPVPFSKLTHFIVTGGGASLVGEQIKEELEDRGPEIKVGNQWDTVTGYKIAREVMK